jgi:methylated-DNA-[protein]-cysteine S-methyltransferase
MDEIETPIGTIFLMVSESGALTSLGFERPQGLEAVRSAEAREQIRAYFAGDLRALDTLRVEPEGTPFQKAVWKLLREIPPGETRSYGELAARLGSHPRAVGAANGANPVALVVPCHRVIGKSGALTGYAWGVDRKEWLLRHERAALGRATPRMDASQQLLL